MTCSVCATCKGPSSDEIVSIFQQMLNDLYLPDENGNYKAGSFTEARNILYGTQPKVFGFLKNLVNQMEEDEALAMLAEIDHRLTFPDPDFKFEYDVPPTGRSDVPYPITLRYGDPNLGFVKITVDETVR